MTGRFVGKVAIVTGGGAGIGAATARRLAREGASVIVTGRRAGPLQAVADEIGGMAVVGDVADADHARQVVALALQHYGGVDVLIANAGGNVFGDLESADLANWRANFAVNTDGCFLFAKAAVPEMRKRGGGAIVFVASMAALSAAPGGVGYISSKAALLGLNRSIAIDYGPAHIRSNVVCPGWVRTEMAEAGLTQLAQHKGCSVDDLIERTTRLLPLRKMAQPDELASVIAFLASDDASFMTGSTLVADGGGAIVDAGMVGVLS
jgi:NAD(P)-dependent dehydrogenase (short-subunit alcohol dehydrogenase family)